MKVLVVNSGSSSIKYQLFDMTDESVLAKGLVERIGISDSIINHYPSDREPVITHQDIPNHRVGIKLMMDALLHSEYGVIKETRAESCEGLEFLGVKIDPEKNKVYDKEAIISNNNSRVKVMAIPTNEELMIAKDTAEISANL